MYKSRVLLFTGNSCPVRVLKTSFKVAPFPEGGGIDFPGQCGMSRDHLLSSFDLKKKKKKRVIYQQNKFMQESNSGQANYGQHRQVQRIEERGLLL